MVLFQQLKNKMAKTCPRVRTILPKRTLLDLLALSVGLTAGGIAIAGKLNVFSTALSVTPTQATPQDNFIIFLGVVAIGLGFMLFNKTRK